MSGLNRRDILRLGTSGTLLTTLVSGARAADDYQLGPDSQPQEGVPQGDIKQFKWTSPRVFPGTERDCWVYIPKQYDGSTPACLMVFQDGGGFQDRNGGFRIPVVFDNLIHRKEMPVTIAVFANPGVVPAKDNMTALPRYNRAFEYDGMGDRYARFLLEELLPEVEKRFSVKLTRDPLGRGLCGASSGGSCSFTAAWERPDAFGKVISFIGSFTDLHGAHNYATMVRKREPKPIRVFMQDGSNDQDIYCGSWFHANNDLSAALRFAGYDVRYITGDGGHSGRQGGSILPDALKWLWRDYPGVVSKVTADAPPESRQPVRALVDKWGGWRVGREMPPGAVIDPSGSFIEADPKSDLIVGFGPMGKSISYDSRRKNLSTETGEIVRGLKEAPLSLVVQNNGVVYWIDGKDGRLWSTHLDGKVKAKLLEGVPAEAPRFGSLILTPDHTFLVAAPHPDSPSRWAWSARLTEDGSTDWQPYFDLFLPYGAETVGVRGLAYDAAGWLYAATPVGIQVLDQAGRVNGILAPPPTPEPPGKLAFGAREVNGPSRLYCAAGGKSWNRGLSTEGFHPSDAPLKPPPPRL